MKLLWFTVYAQSANTAFLIYCTIYAYNWRDVAVLPLCLWVTIWTYRNTRRQERKEQGWLPPSQVLLRGMEGDKAP